MCKFHCGIHAYFSCGYLNHFYANRKGMCIEIPSEI